MLHKHDMFTSRYFALYSLLTPPISLSRSYSWCPKLTGFYGIGYRGKSVALCFELYTGIIIPSINISLSKSKSKYYHTFHLLYSLYSTLLHFPLSPSLLLHFPFLYSPSSITTLTFITLLLIFPFTFYTTLTFITLFHILHSPLLHFSSLALSILLTFHLPYSIFNITILPFIITFSITTLPLYSLFITQPLTNLLFINPSLHSQPPFNTFHIITHSSNIIFNKSLLLFITFHQ